MKTDLIMKTDLFTNFIIYLAFHILPCTSGNVFFVLAFFAFITGENKHLYCDHLNIHS